MKRLIALLLLAFPAVLPAWGRLGHETIAWVAQGMLTARARRMVDRLRKAPGWRRLEPGHGRRFRRDDRELARFCRGKKLDLSLASNWADQWRERHPRTGRLHFVDTPLGSDGSVSAMKRACGGDCILTQLRLEIRVLNDSDAGRLKRLRALLWVVHLMGDLHQPLHCADNQDRGGNAVRVTLLGRPENLHEAWDTGFFRVERVRPRELAEQLLVSERRRPWGLAPVDERSPWVWAKESFWVAKNSVYPQVRDNGGRFTRAEIAKAWPVVCMQLTRAGVRLAEVLNAAAAR